MNDKDEAFAAKERIDVVYESLWEE